MTGYIISTFVIGGLGILLIFYGRALLNGKFVTTISGYNPVKHDPKKAGKYYGETFIALGLIAILDIIAVIIVKLVIDDGAIFNFVMIIAIATFMIVLFAKALGAEKHIKKDQL